MRALHSPLVSPALGAAPRATPASLTTPRLAPRPRRTPAAPRAARSPSGGGETRPSSGKKGGAGGGSRDKKDKAPPRERAAEEFPEREPPRRLAPAFPPPRQVDLIEPGSGRRLECLLRRRAELPGGRVRALLTPLDTAVTLLRSDPEGEFSSPDEEEASAAFPDAAEAVLSQRGLLLRKTPFCLTLRGALAYNEQDVITLQEDASEGGEDSLGIEICTFETRDGSMFLVYSSVDPLVMLAQPSSNEDEWLPVLEDAEQEIPELKAALKSLETELDASAREL